MNSGDVEIRGGYAEKDERELTVDLFRLSPRSLRVAPRLRGSFFPILAILAAACASVPGPSPVGVTHAPALTELVEESNVRRILSALAHDSMEGRKTGTRGANRAAAFIAAEMKSIGLEPAGDSGYVQKIGRAPRRGR